MAERAGLNHQRVICRPQIIPEEEMANVELDEEKERRERRENLHQKSHSSSHARTKKRGKGFLTFEN